MKFEIIDLTLELSNNMPFPQEAYSFVKINEIEKNIYKIEISSQTGTFIEMPWNEFPTDFLLREAQVVDLMDIWMKDIITESRFEKLQIESGAGVILKTKWHSRWVSGDIYIDTPILSLSACDILVGKRIKFIGVDFPLTKEARDLFLSKDIFIIHNLYNLVSLKKDKIFIVIAPLNIKGLRLIPARVFALQPI
jgi:kynurenine formamidase